MRQFLIAACVGATAFGACTIDEQVDPNAPSINSITNDATLNQLNLLLYGLESEIRNAGGYDDYVTATGTVARELYRFDADPRNTSDLLNGKLDNNTFYLTAPYGGSYRVVKTANLLLDALENTSSVTEQAKQGYRGVANTFKAQALQRVANMLGANGIRVDVSDPNNLGPFLSEEQGLAAIENLYDEAFQQLQGATFNFTLGTGYDGFNTPETFARFNRALAARNNLQQKDWAETLENVSASFFVRGEQPELGPRFTFSTASGDALNPLYRIPGNTGNMIFAHPSWVADATPGDLRVARQTATRFKEDGVTLDTFVRDRLNGIYETRKFASSTSPITIISNEELHLIRAEALAQTNDLDGAVALINIVRNLAGIGDYAGARTQAAVIDEVLYQRRYSLWQTGQRFVDLRRYGRLNANFLPIDRDGDVVSPQFPIPLAEGV